MKIKQLISRILDLPIKQRAKAVDQILQTFNQPGPEIEKVWAEEARRRLNQFKQRKIDTILGKQVHQKLRGKYAR